ncbi:hypothetical protein [Nocardioides antri]|uniref:Septum formation-related domain-containing protein n=1 Tax=Nocardioides antri TaxID=2607659 RepID=A0A5B1M3U0_9ACTN|nr:hypothetical protein [Nocardioides antri]KAA1427582.1 hypothetical protein F0U47_08990 [Nocardioides antri]
MTLRLGAGVLLVALTALTTLTAASPARAGVDITPPEVGSCHDLTYDEFLAQTEPEPAVACSDWHNAVTVGVVEFDTAPDWSDAGAVFKEATTPCLTAMVDGLGGTARTVSRSAFVLTTYAPTEAQRNAGAAWIRCDVVLHAADELLKLSPRGLPVLASLPLEDKFARCRQHRRLDYVLNNCLRYHHWRATESIRISTDGWPGYNAARRIALRKCRGRMPDEFLFEWPRSRQSWRAGFRDAICFAKTRS